MRRVGFGAVLALGAALVLAGPAPAADAAACSGSSGVTVVVDFGSLGGVQVGCAAGDPGTGLSALHGAGFGTTGTQHDGPGFVCRINGAPAADRCIATPPASAYWSYWHASRGGSWAYSTAGAASYNPSAGSVEGWSFGAGARPGIAPPAAPAPPPPPAPPAPSAPSAKPTTEPVPGPTVRPAPPQPSTAAPPGAPAPSRTGAPTSRPSVATSSAPTPAPSTSAGASGTPTSTAVAGTEATEEPGPPAGSLPAADNGGSSILAVLGTVVGILLIAAIAVTAFVLDRRRRNAA